jgi:DNA-binding NtrC family response regulator
MKTIPPACTETRILLVDHEGSLREMMAQMLITAGFKTVTAANRAEALAMVREIPIDPVIMNMRMPGAEGIGCLIALRGIAPGMKIIAMAGGPAAAGADFLPLAKSLGASALLGEPLNPETLIGTVRSVLRPVRHQMAS